MFEHGVSFPDPVREAEDIKSVLSTKDNTDREYIFSIKVYMTVSAPTDADGEDDAKTILSDKMRELFRTDRIDDYDIERMVL